MKQGGLAHEMLDQAAVGSFDVALMKHLTQMFSESPSKWQLSEVNVFRLNLDDAREEMVPAFHGGKIHRVQAYTRGAARLPMVGMWKVVVDLLRVHGDIAGFYQDLIQQVRGKLPPAEAETAVRQVLQVLEVLLNQGFVIGTLDPARPVLKLSTDQNRLIHPNEDPAPAAARSN